MRILGTVASSSREVPGAPTIGTATNVGTGRAYNNGAATVTFTAPTVDGGLPITSYTVTSSPGGFTGSGASSPVTVTGLQSSTSYTFTVTATNTAGTGAASSASNSITATTVPQAPTIGTATASAGSATVAYTAGATGGSAITTFTATSSPGSLTGTGASPITVSGLTNGTAYTFTVTATNANGTSTASAASNSVTPVATFYYTVAQGNNLVNRTPDPLSTAQSNYNSNTSGVTIGFDGVNTICSTGGGGRVRISNKDNFSLVDTNFTAQTAFSSGDPRRIRYNGTRWVIVGDAGTGAHATTAMGTYTNVGPIYSSSDSARSMIALPSGRLILGNTAGSIYISDNNGSSWTLQRNIGSSSVPVVGLAYGGSTVCATYDRYSFPTSGIERSTDNGTNWTRVGVASGDTATNARGNIIATNGSGTWVTSRSQNFIYSTNDGASWTDGGILTGNNIRCTNLAYYAPSGIFIYSASDQQNYTSPTGTGSWTYRSNLTITSSDGVWDSAIA